MVISYLGVTNTFEYLAEIIQQYLFVLFLVVFLIDSNLH